MRLSDLTAGQMRTGCFERDVPFFVSGIPIDGLGKGCWN